MLASLGAPVADTDETNPDWIPSLHMGYNNSNSPGKVKQKFTKLKRCQNRKKIYSALSSKVKRLPKVTHLL